jgi:predicted NBD/HSP70 family sugar kinase
MPEGVIQSDGVVIGVDVDGTKVAAGFVDPDGKITTQVRAPMVAHGAAAEGLAAVTGAIDSLLSMGPTARGHSRHWDLLARAA